MSEEAKPAHVGERFKASRPGWSLAAIMDVALPYWRISARLRVLTHKKLGSIPEYVLRSIDAGIVEAEDVRDFLGLGNPLLEATIVDLLADELIAWNGSSLRLTRSGSDTVRKCVLVVPEVVRAEIEWDGLLRRPVAPLSAYLEPRDLRERGTREIPPSPSTAPDAEEMRSRVPQIEGFIRQAAGRRVQSFDLLDVGGIERRTRVFRPATALVFERESGNDVQVSLVIDGRISDEHEQAFAKAGLVRRLGIRNRGLPSQRRGIERVSRALNLSAPHRSVAPHEHDAPLRIALERSSNRLVIIGRELRDPTVDEPFIELLEARLAGGADVTIAWTKRPRQADACDERAASMLKELATVPTTGRLTLGTVSLSFPGLLLMDDRFALLTSYDYLGRLGGGSRGFHDERGSLFRDADSVVAIADSLAEAIKPLR